MTSTAPPLTPDLIAGLKRVQLAHFRPVAAELLQTATTQRWSPEQLLRTLLTTEIAGRDRANQAARLKAAGFPVEKTFDAFQIAVSSVPEATVNYVASLEWLHAQENLCLIGPAGTGKTHLLLAAGRAAVLAGHKVKYLIAADLVETLYRGLADNTVGKVIDTLLRHDAILVDELGFAPLDEVGTQLLFRFVAAAYERRSLGVASHWPFDQWGRFLPQQSTAASLLDRLLHHAVIVVTDGESFRMKEARSRTPARRIAPFGSGGGSDAPVA
ncbi:MAG: ATP-binding protein [Actinobacteria bacterium]|nr:MAG: ATP-binding protein [Actinomycetota bacterium]